METKLLYLQDTYLFKHSAKVLNVSDDKNIVILDQTLFHYQGGGQPSDIGYIRSSDSEFQVEKAQKSKDSGIVEHVGKFTKGNGFKIGEQVEMEIDAETRILHTRLHSGGHLLDVAVRNSGMNKWDESKGMHFPSQAFVEFNMNGQQPDDKDELLKKIQKQVDELIEGNSEVIIRNVPFSELKNVIGYVPTYLVDDGKPIRVVTYGGLENGISHPCTGTHVKSLGEIKHLKVRKYKKKGKIVRISYEV